jgi:hypothetical protein
MLREGRRVLLLPDDSSRVEVERGHQLVGILTAVQIDPAVTNERRRVSLADCYTPDLTSGSRPRGREERRGNDAVT